MTKKKTKFFSKVEQRWVLVDARDKVLEEVISKIDIELPTSLIDSELEARRQQVNQQLAQAGMTVEEYLEDSEEEVDNAFDLLGLEDEENEELNLGELIYKILFEIDFYKYEVLLQNKKNISYLFKIVFNWFDNILITMRLRRSVVLVRIRKY